MTIVIPSGRTLPLGQKAGGGFASLAVAGETGDLVLPAANLYRQTYESKTPDPGDLNTINFNHVGLFNSLGGDLDGGSTGLLFNTGSGIIDPPTQVPGKDWRPYEGQVAMRVSYAADANGTANGQPFEHDTIASRDLWVRFWVRVPTNFAFTDDNNSQHKWAYFKQDAYSNSGEGSTVWINTYSSSSGHATVDLPYRAGSSGVQDAYAVSGSRPNLFHSVDDRGRWMRLILKIRLNSAPGANDGELALYRVWEGSSTLDVLITATGLNLYRSTVVGKEGFTGGYIMNAREGVAAERQDYLIDVLEMADTPLVPAGTEGL